MRSSTRARIARSAVLAVALALFTSGPGHGLVVNDHSSTLGAQAAQPAPGRAGPVPETARLRPTTGTAPSTSAPAGSTLNLQPPARSLRGEGTPVVDRSDKGVKNLPVTRDRGTKNLPERRDLGDR